MQYYLNKDNARMQIDNFEVISSYFFNLWEIEPQVNETFVFPEVAFDYAYKICFENGYILQKVYGGEKT